MNSALSIYFESTANTSLHLTWWHHPTRGSKKHLKACEASPGFSFNLRTQWAPQSDWTRPREHTTQTHSTCECLYIQCIYVCQCTYVCRYVCMYLCVNPLYGNMFLKTIQSPSLFKFRFFIVLQILSYPQNKITYIMNKKLYILIKNAHSLHIAFFLHQSK